VGNEFNGILIDAGISARSVKKFLAQISVSVNSLMGILITHNHFDHIKGLEVMTRKNSIPAFTTKKIWDSILDPPMAIDITRDCVRYIPLQQKFHLAGFDIEAFPVFHDAPETVGYHICCGDKKITIVTDLGHVCETAAPYIKAANLLVIESNYDEQMLREGMYPYYLKARIQSNNGHLGNHQTSGFLVDAIHDGLSHICLAHLSKNNNTPDKALKNMQNMLEGKCNTLQHVPKIVVLNRTIPSDLITLSN
jgi:phosphoribosyl 1,2-cyclic phosphodiesterase